MMTCQLKGGHHGKPQRVTAAPMECFSIIPQSVGYVPRTV